MRDGRVQEGQKAPDFSLKNTRGERVKLSDFQGKKTVYLVFNRGFF